MKRAFPGIVVHLLGNVGVDVVGVLNGIAAVALLKRDESYRRLAAINQES